MTNQDIHNQMSLRPLDLLATYHIFRIILSTVNPRSSFNALICPRRSSDESSYTPSAVEDQWALPADAVVDNAYIKVFITIRVQLYLSRTATVFSEVRGLSRPFCVRKVTGFKRLILTLPKRIFANI